MSVTTVGRGASFLENIDKEVCSVYEHSKAAIVKVHAQRLLQIGNLSLVPSHRIGTGFFIDPQGHLLTAATVVAEASSCWIDWNGQKTAVRILGRDLQTNLALLQIEVPGTNIATPFLPLGNSDELRVGSMVIVIGFPYDLASSPVVGVVGGVEIQRGNRVFSTSHIRASCHLSPGQGGGPLLNSRGEVVGIAVAAHMEDQCYALPINAARKVYSDILQFGQPQRAWVGLGIAEHRQGGAQPGTEQSRVIIQQVYSNAPAADAGFCEGDVLKRIGTNEVRCSADVLNTMFFQHVGDRLDFTVLRDGQEKSLSLIVAAQPTEEPVVVHTVPEFNFFKFPPRPVAIPASHEQ